MKKLLLASALLVSSLSYGYMPDQSAYYSPPTAFSFQEYISYPFAITVIPDGNKLQILSEDMPLITETRYQAYEKSCTQNQENMEQNPLMQQADMRFDLDLKQLEEAFFGIENITALKISFENFLTHSNELLFFSFAFNDGSEKSLMKSMSGLKFNNEKTILQLTALQSFYEISCVIKNCLKDSIINNDIENIQYYKNKQMYYNLINAVLGYPKMLFANFYDA